MNVCLNFNKLYSAFFKEHIKCFYSVANYSCDCEVYCEQGPGSESFFSWMSLLPLFPCFSVYAKLSFQINALKMPLSIVMLNLKHPMF